MKRLLIFFILLFSVPCWGLDFDGTDDIITVSDSTSLDIVNELTIGAWVYKTADALQTVVGKNASWRLRFQSSSDLSGFIFTSGTNASSSNSACATSSNVWHHIAMVYDTSDDLIMYIDGVECHRDTAASGTIDVTADDVTIGALGAASRPFSGEIKDVFIKAGALTAAQLLKIFNAGAKRIECQHSPVDYWPMDDGSDGVSANGDTVGSICGSGINSGTADDGANNTGLTWKAEPNLSYP